MGEEGKGKATFDVEWEIRDKDGNLKDKGATKGVEVNGDVSE